MFDQLDDPGGFQVDAAFFAATSRRLSRRRRKRAATRVGAAAACAAFAVPGLFGAYQGRRVEGTQQPDISAPDENDGDTHPTDTPDVSTPAPSDTFPPLSTAATNILIVGTDIDRCSAAGSPSSTSLGGRTDTIMVLRLDPSSSGAALLSFPRDLWVGLPGMGRGRINAAFTADDPTRLIDTLAQEFGVPVDHFIQVDFCGFANLIDAIGGVKLPLQYALRDETTGVSAGPGCTSFSGEEALAYVRSRHLQYLDAAGHWHEDPTSDPGRIARQQDLLRRTLSGAMADGLLRPSVISALYATFRDDLVVDTGLTIDKMIELAGALRNVKPSDIRGYQIEGTGTNIAGSAVLMWNKDSTHMQAILDVFRGVAPLQGSVGDSSNSVVDTTSAGPEVATATPNRPLSAIVPDPNATC